jgi:phage shock protein A
MTAELGGWLAELGESEPATAAEVGAALVAVLDAADLSALAILGRPSTAQSPDPRETADYACQQLLEELQQVRRAVADVASSRQRADLRLGAERAAGADAARLAELEHDLAAVRQTEVQLAEHSQRLQREVDSFRTAKETAKAIYTVADAQLRIAEAIGAASGEPEPDLGQLRAQCRAAEQRLRALAASQTAPGLLELRANSLGSEIRVLLAVEPADTVTLLAVLEGPEAVSEHGVNAVKLASDLLTEIREDGWPADMGEVTLEDTGAFLARFFPADDGGIGRRAEVLATK